MIFIEADLRGAYIIEPEPFADNRGFFARIWCQREFSARGLAAELKQTNISFNNRAGTLRGMHYQVAPYQETKLVRCTKGAIYDVIIDLRPESPTFMQWMGAELSDSNHKMLYVPKDFAHGFQTLTDDVEISYQVSEFYTPGAERGIRWDDPSFGVAWPLPVSVISEKDASWPKFELGDNQ